MEQNKRYKFFDISLLLYLCAHMAHKQSSTVDRMIIRVAFVLLVLGILWTIFRVKRVQSRSLELFLWSILFLGYVALSSLWATDPNMSQMLFGALLQQSVLCFGLAVRIRNKDDCKRAILIFFIAVLYLTILLVVRTPISDYGSVRLGSHLGLNANGLGMRLALGALCSMFFLLSHTAKKTTKFLLFVATLVLICLVLFTGSRKALFVCVVGFCTMYLILGNDRIRFRKFIIIMLIISVGLYLIFNVDALYDILGKRIESLLQYRTNSSFTTDSSAFLRSELAKSAKEVFLDNFMFGCGANNFMLHNSFGYYAHNNYWELLSTLGIVGFTIYYALYASTIFRLYASLRNKRTDTGILLLLFIIIVLICETGLVSYNGIIYVYLISLGSLYTILPEDIHPSKMGKGAIR